MAKFTVFTDMIKTLRTWQINLKNLSVENVKGKEFDINIPSGTEIIITHTLNTIPTRFILTEAKGTTLIVKGDEVATINHFYLKNIDGSNDFTGKVLIMP